MSLERAIKWLQVILGFLIVGIVIENALLFALMDGLSIRIALVVCFIIIGLRVQRKVNDT
jgi:hypothetical protein